MLNKHFRILVNIFVNRFIDMLKFAQFQFGYFNKSININITNLVHISYNQKFYIIKIMQIITNRIFIVIGFINFIYFIIFYSINKIAYIIIERINICKQCNFAVVIIIVNILGYFIYIILIYFTIKTRIFIVII